MTYAIHNAFDYRRAIEILDRLDPESDEAKALDRAIAIYEQKTFRIQKEPDDESIPIPAKKP